MRQTLLFLYVHYSSNKHEFLVLSGVNDISATFSIPGRSRCQVYILVINIVRKKQKN